MAVSATGGGGYGHYEEAGLSGGYQGGYEALAGLGGYEGNEIGHSSGGAAVEGGDQGHQHEEEYIDYHVSRFFLQQTHVTSPDNLFANTLSMARSII